MSTSRVASKRSLFPSDPLHICAVLVLALGMLVFGGAKAASGQGNGLCGHLSVDLPSVQLLNNEDAGAAGPFAISLPSGTYDITAMSFDPHSTGSSLGDQTMEQWYFDLDSGYTSGFTTDIADDADWSTTVWPAQQINDTATALAVIHRGDGGVNSVHPVCVGFSVVAAKPETPTTAEPSPTGDVSRTDMPVKDQETAADDQPSSDSDTDSNDVTDVIADVSSDVTTEVKSKVEVRSSSASLVRENGQIESIPQLALTGPASTRLTVLALAMLVIGCGLMAASELRELSKNRRR